MICEICDATNLVPPSGPEDAEILIFGEFPGPQEIRLRKPWVGGAGKILRQELRMAGINMDLCRVTNLWLHPKTSPGTKASPNPLYPYELNWHFLELRKELPGRKYILMMGSEVAPIFADSGISNISGTFIKHPYFEEAKVMAMINPAAVAHTTVGEVRLAITRFGKVVNE